MNISIGNLSPSPKTIIEGLIVGIILLLIERISSINRKDKYYYFHVVEADKEAIKTVKSLFEKQDLLDSQVIKSLLSSVSRKYTVKVKDLYSEKEICEELINEISHDESIGEKNKAEYINKITNHMLNGIVEKPTLISAIRKAFLLLIRFIIIAVIVTIVILYFVPAVNAMPGDAPANQTFELFKLVLSRVFGITISAAVGFYLTSFLLKIFF